MSFDEALEIARTTEGVSHHEQISALLGASSPEETERLALLARETANRRVGREIYLRGLLEISNICSRNCLYCGIRSDNSDIERYAYSDDEVVNCARKATKMRFGAIVIQSGELNSDEFISRIERITARIKEAAPSIEITLSCGEQQLGTYKRWKSAGADKYLLRIETTNRRLFRSIHCPKSDFDARSQAIDFLRESGFQVGTGVMIGLPGQSTDDLANDIQFFIQKDVDMLGMGPFIPHQGTPMRSAPDTQETRCKRMRLSLNMISVARIALKDINIAASTALETLSPGKGRIDGILAGANVIMPNVGIQDLRGNYSLYPGKNTEDEDIPLLQRSVEAIGYRIAWGKPGTSAHYLARMR